MHIASHMELDEPQMLCPFRTAPDGAADACMGEPCALWYRATDRDYSGCSAFVAAFYACNTSYNTRTDRYQYHRRE